MFYRVHNDHPDPKLDPQMDRGEIGSAVAVTGRYPVGGVHRPPPQNPAKDSDSNSDQPFEVLLTAVATRHFLALKSENARKTVSRSPA